MNAEEKHARRILQSLGVAVLSRTGPKQYELFDCPPPFYTELFPGEDGKPSTSPWEASPLLEFFMEDAEAFFEGGQQGKILSGVWQEDGKTEADTALIAAALCDGDMQVVIIRLLDGFLERVDVVRKARTQILENRDLSVNLEYFREKSRFDGLTKLHNKSTFTEILQEEIIRNRALELPLSLLMIDVDNFKRVNDTYGHLAGDKVLEGIGALLLQTLRRHDAVARFGGEEFVVLIPQESTATASVIAEKIRLGVEEMTLEAAPSVTVSIGCAEYRPDETPSEFIAKADAALYDAKTSGKNKVCIR